MAPVGSWNSPWRVCAPCQTENVNFASANWSLGRMDEDWISPGRSQTLPLEGAGWNSRYVSAAAGGVAVAVAVAVAGGVGVAIGTGVGAVTSTWAPVTRASSATEVPSVLP